MIKFLIYGQPFIWIFLLYNNNHYLDKLFSYLIKPFYLFGFVFIINIIINKVSFDFYTTELIVIYTFFVLTVTYCLESVYDFKVAICLGFLLTFINSFYWEFMLHIVAFLHVFITPNFFIQSWHLIPIPFLIKKFSFNNERVAFKLLLYGLILSAMLVTLRGSMEVLGFEYNWFIFNNINRCFCLYILTKVFYEHGRLKEND